MTGPQRSMTGIMECTNRKPILEGNPTIVTAGGRSQISKGKGGNPGFSPYGKGFKGDGKGFKGGEKDVSTVTKLDTWPGIVHSHK